MPVEIQLAGRDVATNFFALTFGSLSSAGDRIAPRVLAAFMAVSSLGKGYLGIFEQALTNKNVEKGTSLL